MPKRKLTLEFTIPKYIPETRPPSHEWKKAIHSVALDASETVKVSYKQSDRLEIYVHLYLAGRAVGFHDVDNRLKQIMDALQGSLGSKGKKRKNPIIPNDNQVYKVVVEKRPLPKQSRKEISGKILIRKFRVK